jgi:Domain of unknown function (DUF4034)
MKSVEALIVGIGLLLFTSGLAVAEPQELNPALPDVFNNISTDEEGPHAVHQWDIRVSTYFGYGTALSWQGLEKWCDEYTKNKTKQIDGSWTIDLVMRGFSDYFNGVTGKYDAWNTDHKKIKDWQAAYPKSVCAPLAEVVYWEAYAWHARGHGYADTVTPEGWKLFGDRLANAQKVLSESKAIAASNPSWYTQQLIVWRGLQKPSPDMLKLLVEGLNLYPDYFQSSAAMINELLPSWGGTWNEVDAFVRTVVGVTQKTQKQSMYARLYWSVFLLEGNTFELFTQSLADWGPMKTGFDDLMALNPKSAWNLNNYISFACRADDKATYLKLRPRITKETFYSGAWSPNHSMDVCDAHFGTNQPL